MKKNNKSLTVYLIILVVILLGVNIWYLVSNNNRWGEILKLSENQEDIPVTTEAIELSRIQVVFPNEDSIIDKQNPVIKLQGKMQGFFEGVMNYRIVNENQQVVREGYIMAKGDNYEQMADFSEDLVLTSSEAELLTAKNTVIFYEVSMKDGTENILIKRLLKLE